MVERAGSESCRPAAGTTGRRRVVPAAGRQPRQFCPVRARLLVFLPFFSPTHVRAHPRQPRDPADSHEKRDFIRQIVREDLASGKHQAIKTRFPPEPNGYLHIGHAKSICLNFGIAGEFSGVCNLRFDDTNPAKEDPEYVAAIQDDVRWLGFEWNELRHASDYFQAYYLAAEKLIEQGKAYVCDLSAEEVRAYRGTLTEPGRPSPWRDRSVEENLDLFRRMRAGEFGWRAHPAREDRHGQRQHQPARSCAVPHQARRAPEHRQRVANLPDVRLRPCAG